MSGELVEEMRSEGVGLPTYSSRRCHEPSYDDATVRAQARIECRVELAVAMVMMEQLAQRGAFKRQNATSRWPGGLP